MGMWTVGQIKTRMWMVRLQRVVKVVELIRSTSSGTPIMTGRRVHPDIQVEEVLDMDVEIFGGVAEARIRLLTGDSGNFPEF